MIIVTSKVVCHRSTNMKNNDQIFRYAFVSAPKDSVKTQKNQKNKKEPLKSSGRYFAKNSDKPAKHLVKLKDE